MRALAGSVVAALVLSTTPSRATGPNDDAAAHYDRGASAFDRGDFPRAAAELARADELAPNGVTLELALSAVLKTDDAALAMTLAERADTREFTKKLDAAAHAARRKFAARVGRLSVVCPQAPCSASLDGAAFEIGRVQYVAVGRHEVKIVRGTRVETDSIDVAAGKTIQLVPKAIEEKPRDTPPPPAPKDEATTVEPLWFWVGVGITATFGAASIVSGVDALNRHDDFESDRSDADAAAGGRSAQTRTNILFVATGVAAAATAAVGIFLVRWNGTKGSAAILGPTIVVSTAF
jgi:hypothetical protein